MHKLFVKFYWKLSHWRFPHRVRHRSGNVKCASENVFNFGFYKISHTPIMYLLFVCVYMHLFALFVLPQFYFLHSLYRLTFFNLIGYLEINENRMVLNTLLLCNALRLYTLVVIFIVCCS